MKSAQETRSALRRWARRLAIASGSLILILSLALLILSNFPALALGPVNEALQGAVPGKLHIDHIDSVSASGLKGVDARLYHPGGREVARVWDLSVQCNWADLIAGVTGDDLAVFLDSVSLESLHLDLGAGDNSSSALLEALLPPDSPGDQGSTELLVQLDQLSVSSLWLYGSQGGTVIDSTIEGLSTRLSLTSNVVHIPELHLRANVRGPAKVPTFRLRANTLVALPTESDGPLAYRSAIDVEAASSRLTVRASGRDQFIDASWEGRLGTRDAQRLKVVDSNNPVSLKGAAVGSFDSLMAETNLKWGDAEVGLLTQLHNAEQSELSTALEVDGLDPADLGAPEVSPIRARLYLQARENKPSLPLLDRWDGQLHGQVDSLHASGSRIPALSFKAQYTDRTLRLQAAIAGTRPSSMLDLQARVGKSGAIEEWDVVARLRGDEVEPYIPDWQVDGTISVRAQGVLSEGVGEMQVGAELDSVRGPEGFAADDVALSGDVWGSLDEPRVNVALEAGRLVAGGQTFESVRLRGSGKLSSARISGQLKYGDSTAQLRATASLRGGALQLSETALAVTGEGSRLDVSVDALSVENGEIQFRNLRLSGLGSGELSGSWSPQAARLDGWLRDVPAGELAELAGVPSPASALVDLDADFSMTGTESAGRLRLVLASARGLSGEVPVRLPPLDVHLDVIGSGASLELMARVEGQPAQADERGLQGSVATKVLVPASHNSPRAWLNNVQRVSLEGDIPADSLGPLLDQTGDWEGRIVSSVAVERATLGAPLSLDAELRLLQVGATFQTGAEVGSPLTRIDGLDALARWTSRAGTEHSEVLVSVSHRDLPIGLARARVGATPDDVLEVGPRRDWRKIPFETDLEVFPLWMGTLPAILRPVGIEGRLGARLQASGSLQDPTAELSVSVADLGQKETCSACRLSGQMSTTYEGGELKWDARMRNDDGSLSTSGTLLAHWDARDMAFESRSMSGTMRARGFRLETVPLLQERDIEGVVDIDAELSDWGEPTESFVGDVRLPELTVRGVPLRGVKITTSFREGQFDGKLRMTPGKFTVHGEAHAEVERSGLFGLTPRGSQRGAIAAQNVPLQLFTPFARDAGVVGLEGLLDLRASVETTAAKPVVVGKLEVRDGGFQIPELGQRLHDIDLSGSWNKNGDFRLTQGSFSGTSGRATVDAKAKMDGLLPQTASLALAIDRQQRLPVSLLGMGTGELWGELQTQVAFDHEERRATVDTNVESLHFWFPELPTRSVQDLAPPEHVDVGVVSGEEFVQVELQPVSEEPASRESDGWDWVARVDFGDEFWLKQGPTRRVQLRGDLEARSGEDLDLRGEIRIPRGRFELNGRQFEVVRGVITMQEDDPSNPLIVAEAQWESPDGIVVVATFSGPAQSGEMTLSSDPPLREDQIVSLLLFGDTAGLNEAEGQSSGSNQAAVVGGGVATRGLNQALGRFEAVDVSTRVRGEDGNVRPEVVVQLTDSLSAQVGYNLEQPSPGKSPDRTLLTLELRLVGGSALSATLGDRGSTILDWIWRYRY